VKKHIVKDADPAKPERFADSSFLEYCRAEHEEIDRHKWIESEKLGHDIGRDAAVHQWLRHYEGVYRRERITDHHLPGSHPRS
jgi:hypothetical protein